MRVEEIEVVISPQGDVTIKVQGMDGDVCLATTKELEELLGGEILERKRTDPGNSGVQDARTINRRS